MAVQRCGPIRKTTLDQHTGCRSAVTPFQITRVLRSAGNTRQVDFIPASALRPVFSLTPRNPILMKSSSVGRELSVQSRSRWSRRLGALCAVVLGATGLFAQSYTVSTLAGNGSSGSTDTAG